jgi:hypothetical protein
MQTKEVEKSIEAIIEAAVAYNVKRLVVCSSFAAICGALYKKDLGIALYTEEDFAPI